MDYYYLDLLSKCVIARLTDEAEAQALIAALGSRYGIVATNQALVEKAVTVPTGPAPGGGMEITPHYGQLEALGVAYEQFVVADVFADYDLPEAEVHCNESRYELVIDESGFERDVTRILSGPSPKTSCA